MPVWRDASGGVGTPTSDNERTKLSLRSQRLIAIVNGYDGSVSEVTATAEHIRRLLARYAQSDGGTLKLVREVRPPAEDARQKEPPGIFRSGSSYKERTGAGFSRPSPSVS